MIPYVKKFLVDKGYILAGYEGGVNIFMGRNTLLQFFLPREQSIVVKLADINTENSEALSLENTALCENWARYPDLVPKVITSEHSDDYYFLCIEGTCITSARLEDIFKLKGEQVHQMQRLLSGEDRIVEGPCREPSSGLQQFKTACSLLPIDLYQKFEKRHKPRLWEQMIGPMPTIPQHGDLAINNIGKSRQGIIVFDWEDYGHITVPGFDLCVLLFSGTRFDIKELINTINGIYNQKGRKPHFLKNVVENLDVDRTSINDFLMIHLILFHGLKHTLGYGDEVIQNCLRLADELIESE